MTEQNSPSGPRTSRVSSTAQPSSTWAGEHAAVDAVDEAVYRAFRDRRKLRQPSSSRPG